MGKATLKKSVAKSPAKAAASKSSKPPAKAAPARPAAKATGKPTAKAAPAKVVAKATTKSKPQPKVAAKPEKKPLIKAAVAAAPKAETVKADAGKTKLIAAKLPPAKPAAGKLIAKSATRPEPLPQPKINGSKVEASDGKSKDKLSRHGKPARIESKPEPYRPINVVEQAASSGDSKPKKNQAGLGIKELEHFRDLLLEKRRELVGDMSSMEREALQSGDSGLSTLPIHMADMGTDNYEQEFTLGLVEKDRTLLREINHALAKIQNGTYGLCEGNGKPIAKVRLEAQPWARYSIEYARMQEKSPIRW